MTGTRNKDGAHLACAPEKKRKLSGGLGANDGQCAFRTPPEPWRRRFYYGISAGVPMLVPGEVITDEGWALS